MTEDNQTFRLQLLGHQLRQAQELVDGLYDVGRQLAEMKNERDKLQTEVARLHEICDEAFVHLPLAGDEHICYADHNIVPHIQQVAAAWGERAAQEKTIAKLKEECDAYKERLRQRGWQKIIELQNRIQELEEELIEAVDTAYRNGCRDQSAEEAGLHATLVERIATLEKRDQQLQLRAVTAVERLEEFRQLWLVGSTESHYEKTKLSGIVNRCLEIVRGVLRGDAEENPNE